MELSCNADIVTTLIRGSEEFNRKKREIKVIADIVLGLAIKRRIFKDTDYHSHMIPGQRGDWILSSLNGRYRLEYFERTGGTLLYSNTGGLGLEDVARVHAELHSLVSGLLGRKVINSSQLAPYLNAANAA